MKKNIVKKTISVLLIVIISILYYNKVFALTPMTLFLDYDTSKILEEGEVIINIAIDKLEDTGEGVNAYVFMLNFNPDVFEFKKVEGQNNWNTPAYNEESVNSGRIKFAATRTLFAKEAENIAKIILKVKRNLNFTEDEAIKISDISFAAKINNKIQKIELNDANFFVVNDKIQDDGNNAKINNQENVKLENTGNQSLKSSNNIENKSIKPLPKAGIGLKICFPLISVFLVINAVIIYAKHKKIKKYI